MDQEARVLLAWKIKSAITIGLLAVAFGGAQAATKTSSILVGAHHLAFHVTPGHTPIIVLDAGGGLDSSYWNTLVPELARRTGSEIITYDRAGFGDSDELKPPFRIQDAVADLTTGLEQLGATHDLILVPHSFAGEIATRLTLQHPDWVSGAVLVDTNVPEFFTDAEIQRWTQETAPQLTAMKAGHQDKSTRSMEAILATFPADGRAFRQLRWPSTIPCIVIVSEKTPFPPGSSAELWRQAHVAFAEAASNRTIMVARGSSHDVAHDRPDLIIQSIVDMTSLTAVKH